MEGYTVKVLESSKELTARERIAVKDFGNAFALDEATKGERLVITPAWYAVLGVHNEKSDNKDYKKYIVVDTNGTKYVTGSDNFFSAFKEIVDEMAGRMRNTASRCTRWRAKTTRVNPLSPALFCNHQPISGAGFPPHFFFILYGGETSWQEGQLNYNNSTKENRQN